jgi:hypothetical protein
MGMNDLSGFLHTANRGDPTALHELMQLYEPDKSNPELMPGVITINQLRMNAPGKFEPQQNAPDPAASAIAQLRGMMPPQEGLLLCSVPPGKGLLCAADDTRYVFFTEAKYTVVTAKKRTTSELLVLPAGRHMLYIAVYSAAEDDPAFMKDPFLECPGMVEVVPGQVTEVVAARENNFKEMTYHVVYH